MIEDVPKNIKSIATYIPVLCYDSEYNRTCEGKNIQKVYTWYEVFDKIKKLKWKEQKQTKLHKKRWRGLL